MKWRIVFRYVSQVPPSSKPWYPHLIREADSLIEALAIVFHLSQTHTVREITITQLTS